jgi:hypothetical protein
MPPQRRLPTTRATSSEDTHHAIGGGFQQDRKPLLSAPLAFPRPVHVPRRVVGDRTGDELAKGGVDVRGAFFHEVVPVVVEVEVAVPRSRPAGW